MKIIVTFGSKHLQWLRHILNPMNVALIVEGENEAIARQKVFNSKIGECFATSYPYDEHIEALKRMGMSEYSLEDLEALKHHYICRDKEGKLFMTEELCKDKEEAIQYVGDNEVLYPFIEEVYTKNISDKKA